MAIDTSLWAVDIAAGSVSAGDVFELTCTDGPAVVRSGRGAALLKRMTSFKSNANGVIFKMYFVNSDWIDPAINEIPSMSVTTLDKRTGCYQSGNNCALTPNSSWRVYAVAETSGTATTGTLFGLIDIDYPSVSSIIDPDAIPGIPTSIELSRTTTTIAAGSFIGSGWDGQSEDFFKAGYEYALQKVSIMDGSTTDIAFLSLSNAAGMGGLNRIVPCGTDTVSIRSIIEYASKLVKGPMDVKTKIVSSSAASTSACILMDYVKRRIA